MKASSFHVTGRADSNSRPPEPHASNLYFISILIYFVVFCCILLYFDTFLIKIKIYHRKFRCSKSINLI
jgi:hypothetical protein